ncbi:MAG: hypothetical protein H6728_00790 [Myxococcales bacterium]|nr:hypothetical protein [Myxococcales bacterium]
MTLSATAKRYILAIHIIFASVWVGAIAVLFLLALKGTWTTHPAQRELLHATFLHIEYILIIPPAFGSLITGGILSWKTNWGFFVYRWVVAKWIATIALILFGAFFLNTWLEGMYAIVLKQGGQATLNKLYQRYAQNNLIFVPIQWVVLLFLVVISSVKPWGKRKTA